jgi:glutamate-1-semialdehyde 2,1-aminomutase
MDLVSRGEVGQAGTFKSNPVVMPAAAAPLRELEQNAASINPRRIAMGQRLMDGVRPVAAAAGRSVLVDGPGPVFQFYLTDQRAVRSYRDFAQCDLATMGRLHTALVDRGVNMVCRGLWFRSAANTVTDIDQTIVAMGDALAQLA